MSAPDMLAEILRLPVEERPDAASIRKSRPALHAWNAEITRRSAEVDAGTAETMTVDEYRAHVRQRRAARARR